jgi:uncharacterized DUF497 family protein
VRIDFITCPEVIQEKLESKHQVTLAEARQLLLSRPRIRFAEQGHVPGEDVYAALGQTLGGRHMVVFFVYKPEAHAAIIISARDMSTRERKSYGRK